ncbi:MAG TPA: hypothetical protein VGS96_14255 [Thermoanaerobaculia bacterium]|jgi:hypothetical protein|nr:hypothetical protein [Thermoanaerobaculia bacterium]
MKTIASPLVLLLALGCASSPLTSSHETGGNASVASVTNNPKNAPDYILLSSPDQIRTVDFSSAVSIRGLHVRGTLTNRGFIPAGEIQGNGKFCTDGKDWLSLSDLKVYTAFAGKTPTAPYIVGCAINSGFQPASRAIVAQ